MVLHLALAWEPLWLFFAEIMGSSAKVCQQMRYIRTFHSGSDRSLWHIGALFPLHQVYNCDSQSHGQLPTAE